jgi:hypothetical protein
MGFSTISALVSEEVTHGKFWDTYFQKTIGAAAYTAGRWYDLSMVIGTPRLNVYPGGLQESTKLWYKSSGSIYSGMPVNAGETKHLTRAHVWAAAATTANSLFMLCDYLMFYPLFDGDSAAEMIADTTIALPRYPTGEGVQMFLVVTSDLGATPGVQLRVQYQNSAGVLGRWSQFVTLTASAIPTSLPHTGVLGGAACGPFIPLQDGDTGVRKIQSVELTQGTGAGYMCIVLVKPLYSISHRAVNAPTERCLVINTPTIPAIKDEAFLSFLCMAGGNIAAASLISGGLRFVWGNS